MKKTANDRIVGKYNISRAYRTYSKNYDYKLQQLKTSKRKVNYMLDEKLSMKAFENKFLRLAHKAEQQGKYDRHIQEKILSDNYYVPKKFAEEISAKLKKAGYDVDPNFLRTFRPGIDASGESYSAKVAIINYLSSIGVEDPERFVYRYYKNSKTYRERFRESPLYKMYGEGGIFGAS